MSHPPKMFLIIVFAMLFPPLTHTVIFYVSKNTKGAINDCGLTQDNPCPTIQAALDRAKANSQIQIVASDTAYKECPIIVRKPFNLLGIQGTPVIDCEAKNDGLIVDFNVSIKAVKTAVNLGVIVENIKFQNAKRAIYYAKVKKVTNVRISKAVFEENVIDIRMEKSRVCLLSMNDVTAKGLTGYGIQFESCAKAKATLTNTKFLGKYFKVNSTMVELDLTMDKVTFDMKDRTKSDDQAVVHIETANKTTKIHIKSSDFFNQAGKARGSVRMDSPQSFSRKSKNTGNSKKSKKSKKRKNATSIVVFFNKVNFVNNSASTGYGGAFSFNTTSTTKYLRPVHVNFQGCSFRRNSAHFQGGALWFGGRDAKTIQLTDCEFRENQVFGSDDGQGGAVFAAGGKFVINDCRFYENSASRAGGTLYFLKSPAKIKDTTFQNGRVATNGIQGDVLYMTHRPIIFLGKVILDLKSANFQKSIIWYKGNGGLLQMNNETRFTCPRGYNYQELDDTSRARPVDYHFFGFKCVPCHNLFYSGSRGYQQVNGTHFEGKCHECPYGASCNGTIRARANFWGVARGDTVQMIPCPRGYCCNREPCESHDSCRSHRTGTLCGRCEEGFSEGISSTACYPNEVCDSRYACLLAFDVIFIFIVLLFQQELITRLAKILLWDVKTDTGREYRPRNSDPDEVVENDHVQHGSTSDERSALNSLSVNLPNRQDVNRIEESESFNNVGGYIKVFFYFFQVVMFLRVSPYSSHSNYPNRVLDFIIPFLNFQFSDMISDCMIKDLKPVKKILFKNTVCVWVFLLAVISYVFYKVSRWVRTKKFYSEPLDNQPAFKSRSFPVRLTGALMQLTLLSYIALLQLCASLLHCVEVEGHHVLHIDGTVVCYNRPQVFIWLFAAICVFPFPFVLIFGRRLLISGRLSPGRFLAACFLPSIFLIYWAWLYYREFRGQPSHQVVEPGRDPQTDKILYILQHPYKRITQEEDARTWSDYMVENWEGILMIRRLLVVMVFIFVDSPVSRAFGIFVLSLCILLHHVWTKPFANKWVNSSETFSLALITLFSGFGMTEACFSFVGEDPPSLVANMQSLEDWFMALLLFIILAVVVSPRAIYCFLRWRLRCQSPVPTQSSLEHEDESVM